MLLSQGNNGTGGPWGSWQNLFAEANLDCKEPQVHAGEPSDSTERIGDAEARHEERWGLVLSVELK